MKRNLGFILVLMLLGVLLLPMLVQAQDRCEAPPDHGSVEVLWPGGVRGEGELSITISGPPPLEGGHSILILITPYGPQDIEPPEIVFPPNPC